MQSSKKNNTVEQVETLNKNIPKSSLIIFKGCSHNVHLEETEKFNNTIMDFLK